MATLEQEIAAYRARKANPRFEEMARAQGWTDNGNGNWSRFYNGVSQTLPAGMLASNLAEQQQASYLSQEVVPGGGQNYLQQIQALLQPAGQPQGGASSGQYTNPYEQRLAALVNNPDAIENTNAYKFRFNQGQQALERSAAAKGMLNSGNTLAELARYGQGMASDEYGKEFERLNSATGQRNQYNLGLMGAANQELGLRQQGRSDTANTALRALIGYDEAVLASRRLAAQNATLTGRINAGEKSRTSTW